MPSVRNSWRAMTLLENLLMSRTTSARVGDGSTPTARASAGTGRRARRR
jgi:hypothetical protein